MADQNPFDAYRTTLRDVVASVIASQFIVDYGIITAISTDKKKVDVKHAVIDTLKTGEALDAYETSSVELLYPSSSGLSIKYDVAVNDPVLLIGLKNLVEDTTAVNPATQTAYTHYNQATLKAIPLAGINATAKTRIESDNGTMKVHADTAIELNGNSKQFVTWSELNTALQSHTHSAGTLAVTTAPGAVAGVTGAPVAFDITSAKTTTIKTGG